MLNFNSIRRRISILISWRVSCTTSENNNGAWRLQMSVGDNTFHSTDSECCVKSDRYLRRQAPVLIAISSQIRSLHCLHSLRLLKWIFHVQLKFQYLFNQSPMEWGGTMNGVSLLVTTPVTSLHAMIVRYSNYNLDMTKVLQQSKATPFTVLHPP